MKPPIIITEYESLIAGKKAQGYKTLPERTFNQLEEFILSSRSKDTDALELMSLSAKKGIGKVITAKNYVGVIAMKDGTVIEILPKIFSAATDDSSGSRTKCLLLDMLKTLRTSPYKTLQATNLNIEKMNVLEIFIRAFIDEVFFIAKRGLKCSYETVEENPAVFRGKMKFSQQIRFNQVHRERSYVEYDVFTVNRPENRLLKATLEHLYKHSSSSKNRNDIKTLLSIFGDVEASVDYKSDFAKYVPDRNMKDYETALRWSCVFLEGKSFTSFSGSEVALALLYPMEMLFESYIATLLRKKLNTSQYSISTQDRHYHLFDEPRKEFLIKPDIVVTRNSDNHLFIMDTKWKILSDTKPNYGISQADMYQMYAYQKKYQAQHVTLIYPKTDKVSGNKDIFFQSEDGVRVHLRFIDLFDVSNSMDTLVTYF